jgi:uncharacterized protein (TIGR00369 family)
MTAFFSKTSMLSFLEEVFPQVNGKIDILCLTDTSTSVKLKVLKSDLRPGGTVSGPSMFLLADVTFYIAVLALIGKRPLAVTTNCSINFMRKPDFNDLIADARILKKGRSLIVGDVLLRSSGGDLTVAHANFTYAVPTKEF